MIAAKLPALTLAEFHAFRAAGLPILCGYASQNSENSGLSGAPRASSERSELVWLLASGFWALS